ncbi:MAG TPA: hypothetical protein VGQ09_09800 [Chitinophagaceae bacterium]|jgi:hypothetical protein|nr:hypothetical protein [Chitinophagaceae bacterium]
MEKLKFTVRCIVLLAALPVIMFVELTRGDKVTNEQNQKTAEKISVKTNEVAMIGYTSPFLQAVIN